MAIISPTNEYIRVSSDTIRTFLSAVQIETYKDKETRLNPTKYDKAIIGVTPRDIPETIVQDILKDIYAHLKTLPEFSECTDDI